MFNCQAYFFVSVIVLPSVEPFDSRNARKLLFIVHVPFVYSAGEYKDSWDVYVQVIFPEIKMLLQYDGCPVFSNSQTLVFHRHSRVGEKMSHI